MAEINDIVQVAVDAYRGNIQKYSKGEAMDVLHKALIAANNNSTKLDYKAIRDGKCPGLFTLIEEILSRTIEEGLMSDDFFMSMVDYRNVALGDQNVFLVEDDDLFTVSEVAEGTLGLRRQRLGGVNEITIPTSLKGVRIYEELNRILAGQVDFNTFIRKVSESFRRKMLEEIYALWSGITAADLGGNAYYYNAAGTYDEDALLTLIAHVEAAANGKPATIIGTKAALRVLAPSIHGNDSKSDLYNLGYFGKFYGTDVVALPQRHKVGTTTFQFDDNMLSIIAGDQKPIKYVTEGQTTVVMGQPTDNKDLTQDYFCFERYGMGLVMAGNGGIGRYLLA